MTGILTVALENAKKILQVLLASPKEYVCVMRLHQTRPRDKVEATLSEFQGQIYQRPPLRASVKRKLRTRTIYYLELIETKEKDVLFRVGCESGTYIRKLCHDIGEVLGCGAHMRELRRTRTGPISESEGLTTLHEVLYFAAEWRETGEEQNIRSIVHPMEKALKLTPKVYIRDSAVAAICHGASLTAPGILSVETGIKPKDTIAIFTQKEEAVALARTKTSSEKMLQLDHGIVANIMKVLMDRGTYPKMWSKHENP